MHSVFFDTLSREFVLGSSIRQSRILAEGLPLAGNGKFPPKKQSLQGCIRHFLYSFSRIRPRFVNAAKPYSCRGTPACGKRQIPVAKTIIARLHSAFFVLFLVNPSSVRQYGEAVFLPRVSRLRETANSRRKKQLAVIFRDIVQREN